MGKSHQRLPRILSTFFVISGALLGSACLKPKDVSATKNFVSSDETHQTRILPWPYYTSKESQEAADAVRMATGTQKPELKSLFALSRMSDNPKLCFYGHRQPKASASNDLGQVYTNPELEYSTRTPVSCRDLFEKMKNNAKLASVASKIEADSASAGVDRCVYLSVAMSPPIAAFLSVVKGSLQ